MVALATASLRGFLRGVAQKDLGFAPTPSATILPLLVAATLGKGGEWIRPCIDIAFEQLPAKPAPTPPQPESLLDDERQFPRRLLVAQVKEAIVKSAVLIGVPRSIELAVKLGDFLDDDDLGTPFVRRKLERDGLDVTDLGRDGLGGLRTVYRQDLDDIFANFSRLGLEDLRRWPIGSAFLFREEEAGPDRVPSHTGFISQYITYGTFLTPHGGGRDGPDPLAHDPRLLSIVTLSTLVPQRTEREILWHLRGAIRRGWSRPEVERIQRTIEKVAGACGIDEIGQGMPRVCDVEPQPEESDL